MQDFAVVLSNRDFTDRLAPSDVTLQPTRYSWTTIGGPLEAEIEVGGPEAAVWNAIEWLRCPVRIDWLPGAEPVWWGYVHEVEVRTRGVSLGASLDGMANTVSVIYSYTADGSVTGGDRTVSGPASDAVSVAIYGRKDAQITGNQMTTAAADARRDGELAIRKFPQPVIGAGGEPGATLRLRGWWSTLDWEYYATANTMSVDTTTQMQTILGTAGQFFVSVLIRQTSGLSTNMYRDGQKTAREYFEELLAAGTTNKRRMLATVRKDRWIEVSEEPLSAAYSDYYVDRNLQLWSQIGAPVERWRCSLGWARLKDVIPASADVSYMASISPFWIEESEYNVQDDALTWRARNAPSPWDVPLLDYGPSKTVDDITLHQSIVHMRGASAGLTVPTGGGGTAVPWDTEIVDTDDLHDLMFNTTRITAKYAGRYDVNTQVAFLQNSTGWRLIEIRVSGVTFLKRQKDADVNSPTHLELSGTVSMAAGDYLEVFVTQNSGGNLGIVHDSTTPFVVMKRVE